MSIMSKPSMSPLNSVIKPPTVPVPDALILLNRCKVNKSFTWSDNDEPHAIRRRLILAAHPEIAELFGPEPLTAVVVFGLVIVQLLLAALSESLSWPLIFLIGWSIGGTFNHSLQLAAHELSHNLCFDNGALNKLMAVICNLPTAVPSAITFARYHMDHHVYQGVDGLDTDVPSHMETLLFRSPLGKIAWIFLQPLFYAFRPVCIKPKDLGAWEIINIAVQVSFDALVLYFLGVKAFSYLVIGTFLGLGLHPAAGHFIAEHYEFVTGVETYSYYGGWNIVNFNVGYHNEHHDFPRIPWTRLPKLKQIAAEYYDSLPQHTSYIKLFIKYIFDDSLGPFARVKRQEKYSKTANNAVDTTDHAGAVADKINVQKNNNIKSNKSNVNRRSFLLLWIMSPFFICLISFVVYHASVAA